MHAYFEFGEFRKFGRQFGHLLVVAAGCADDPLLGLGMRGNLQTGKTNEMRMTAADTNQSPPHYLPIVRMTDLPVSVCK